MSSPATTDRGRRLEHQQRAYELQLRGGLEGAAKYTVFGIVAVGIAHRFWPLFRKQTWGLKAFIVSSATMSGLVIGADKYLIMYESAQRDAENAVRRQAQNALARRGIIATETEIRRWRAEQEAERVAAEKVAVSDAQAVDAGSPVNPIAISVVVEETEPGKKPVAVAVNARDVVDTAAASESAEAGLVARIAEARRAGNTVVVTATEAVLAEQREAREQRARELGKQ